MSFEDSNKCNSFKKVKGAFEIFSKFVAVNGVNIYDGDAYYKKTVPTLSKEASIKAFQNFYEAVEASPIKDLFNLGEYSIEKILTTFSFNKGCTLSKIAKDTFDQCNLARISYRLNNEDTHFEYAKLGRQCTDEYFTEGYSSVLGKVMHDLEQELCGLEAASTTQDF